MSLWDLRRKARIVCATCGKKFVVERSRAFVANTLIYFGVAGAWVAAVVWTPKLLQGLTRFGIMVGAVTVIALVWVIEYWLDAGLIRIRAARADEGIERYLGDP
jgi:hypothetical protein